MDLSNYLPIFLEESEENLQIINDNLLVLESNPKEVHAINEIFRAAHTLKGMAATMGFQSIADLTHGIENFLDEIRNGSKSLTPSILNSLFKAFDVLSEGISNLKSGKGDVINLSVLNEFDDNKTVPVKTIEFHNSVDINDYEQTVINNAFSQGFNVYNVKVFLKPECLLKSARAFMVYKELENLGEIIKTIPTVQNIEEELFEDNFEIWIISKHDMKKIKTVENVPEISKVEVSSLDSTNTNSTQDFIEQDDTIEQSKVNIPEQSNQIKNQATIRVDINRLDTLMNLVSELVINKTGLNQSVANSNQTLATEGLEQLHRITTELQNVVMSLRMVPIDRVFSRFPRMVRDTAKDLGKEVDLTIIGKETELDRTIIDEIGDPLVHLIRNAIDHGLESKEDRKRFAKPEKGKIELKAYQSGNEVFIEVTDDGKGIDVKGIGKAAIKKKLLTDAELKGLDEQQVLQLIFEPGFSTKEKVTDLSGRGVGLDVVKTSIESLGGGIEIQTELNVGTIFRIHLPLTLAIIQGLLVEIGNEKFAIPLSSIVETAAFDSNKIKKVGTQEVLMFRNTVLPLVDLNIVLDCKTQRDDQELSIVVVKKGDKQIGLIVDNLIGQQEIVIKHLGDFLSNIRGFAGATISGDGEVILILDTNSLFFN